MENQSDNSYSADLRTSQFVPMISYLPPTLSRLVSLYQLLTRQEVPRTGQGCLVATPETLYHFQLFYADRSLSFSPESQPLQKDLDQNLVIFKDGLSNDLEQD